MLIVRIEAKLSGEAVTIKLPAELRIRESTVNDVARSRFTA